MLRALGGDGEAPLLLDIAGARGELVGGLGMWNLLRRGQGGWGGLGGNLHLKLGPQGGCHSAVLGRHLPTVIVILLQLAQQFLMKLSLCVALFLP